MPTVDNKAIVEIETMAKKLNLPEDIAASAIELFKSLRKEGFVRGRSSVCIALACLYYLTKLDPSCPAVTLKSFANESPCSQKEIFRFYKKIVEKFGMQPQVCTIRPTIYVKSFGQKLGFSEGALKKAIGLSEEMVKEKVHIGKNPVIVAAACLYVVSHICKERKTQAEIAEMCRTSAASIQDFLQQPFFEKKGFKELIKTTYEPVEMDVLKKLVREFLDKIQIGQRGIPIYQLKLKLRLSFPQELKNLSVHFDRLEDVLDELENEGLIKFIKPNCRTDYRTYRKISCSQCSAKTVCWDYRIQPRENN